MRRPVILVGLGLGTLLITLYILIGGSPSETGSPTPPTAEEPSEVADLVGPDLAEVASRSEAPEGLIEAETVGELGPPDSYTAFLGGVIGRIVDVDGTPMPDMRVEALAATLQDFLIDAEGLFDAVPPTFDEVKDVAKTDDEGRFRFERLEPRGVYLLGIDLGGERATLRFVDRAPSPGEIVDLGDIRLDPFVIFFGRVIDEESSPVAGARVRATNLPSIIFSFGVQDVRPGFSVAFQDDLRSEWRMAPIPSWLTRIVNRFPVPTTETAEDGSFRLEGVPIGLVTLLVDKSDLLSLVEGPIPSGRGGEKNVGDLRMRFGETLTGRVVDMEDRPVAGVSIMAGAQIDIAPVALMIPAGVTDKDGLFSAKGLPDIEHVVAARREGGADWTVKTEIVPGYDEAVIQIGESWPLKVTVRNDAGEVIPKPSIVLQKKDRIPLHPLLVPPIDLSRRIRYEPDGSVLIRELDPGNYVVLAKAPGYAVAKEDAPITDEKTEVELSLVPELSVSVDVIALASREPVHYATVSVFDRNASDRAMRQVPLMTRRTDDTGRAILDGLEAGEYAIAVFHPAFAQSIETVLVPSNGTLVELRGGGTLEGLILSNRRPPEEERFITLAAGGRPEFPRFTVTDETGAFRVTHLQPGTHQLIVMRRFANQGLTNLTSQLDTLTPERFEEVTIKEGETTFISIDLLETVDGPTARLAGQILINGVGADRITVRYRPRGSRNASKSSLTDRSGRFDFGEVLAGTGTVSMQRSGRAGIFQLSRLSSRTIELQPDEARDVVIAIQTGSLRGSVVSDRDNQPLVGAQVTLREQVPDDEWTEGTRLETVSGKGGLFSFEEVPSGEYRLRVRRTGFAESEQQEVRVPPQGAPPAVNIRMITGVDVEGKVVLPEGTPPPRFLFVEFRADESRGGGRVDVDSGEFIVKGLRPGTYEATVRGRDLDLQSETVVVPSNGLKGAILRPKPTPPPDGSSLKEGG